MSVSISKAINAASGGAIDPTKTSQNSPFFSSEYSSQASRMVPDQGGMNNSTAFDVTMGRVGSGYVRQTPTTQSGSPIVPRLNANYQMVRDFRPEYVVDAHSAADVPYDIQDSYTMAGTKWRNTSRDSFLNTTARQMGANDVNPITTCAPGEQKLLPGSSGYAAGNVSRIPESAYYNPNALASRSTLVGIFASEPSQQSFESAYRSQTNPSRMQAAQQMNAQQMNAHRMQAAFTAPANYTNVQMAPPSRAIFSSPMSSMSASDFARANLNIP